MNKDQNAEGFRDQLYNLAWSVAICDDYSFDESDELVGPFNGIVGILLAAERTEVNLSGRVSGPAHAN